MAGYGSDVWCTTEIVAGRMAFGVTAVLQACVRRLTTPRGDLWFLVDADSTGDEENSYGLDVSALVGQWGIDTAVEALPSQIESELLKDDRVEAVAVTATRVQVSAVEEGVDLQIEASLVDSNETFAFGLSVTAITAELIRGEAA